MASSSVAVDNTAVAVAKAVDMVAAVVHKAAVAPMASHHRRHTVAAVVAVLPTEAVAAASALAVNDTSWDESYVRVYDAVGIVEMSSHTFLSFKFSRPSVQSHCNSCTSIVQSPSLVISK